VPFVPMPRLTCTGGGARVGEVVSRESLVARVRQARESGRTVAFANGCFDLLHVGHVRYLESAAQEADVLVVAINDDRSVRELKGRGRPILAAEYRAELVAALRCVDFVTVFPESTVGPLLEVLHPDVHCKGTDYTIDTVPERDVVRAYGGRIAIVGDPKEHSTRDLLARIASSEERIEPGVSPTPAQSATKS
jgi:rfaE bifunctional protein nucleotidyltransferase chain/domain